MKYRVLLSCLFIAGCINIDNDVYIITKTILLWDLIDINYGTHHCLPRAKVHSCILKDWNGLFVPQYNKIADKVHLLILEQSIYRLITAMT